MGNEETKNSYRKWLKAEIGISTHFSSKRECVNFLPVWPWAKSVISGYILPVWPWAESVRAESVSPQIQPLHPPLAAGSDPPGTEPMDDRHPQQQEQILPAPAGIEEIAADEKN